MICCHGWGWRYVNPHESNGDISVVSRSHDLLSVAPGLEGGCNISSPAKRIQACFRF